MALPTPMLRSCTCAGDPYRDGRGYSASVLHRRTLIVDGYRGELLVDPEPVLLQEYQRLISEEIELSRLAEDDVNLPAQLKSGERIKVMLNAGLSRNMKKNWAAVLMA